MPPHPAAIETAELAARLARIADDGDIRSGREALAAAQRNQDAANDFARAVPAGTTAAERETVRLAERNAFLNARLADTQAALRAASR